MRCGFRFASYAHSVAESHCSIPPVTAPAIEGATGWAKRISCLPRPEALSAGVAAESVGQAGASDAPLDLLDRFFGFATAGGPV